MQPEVFFAIIACAAIHAVWNGFLKLKVDPSIATTMLAIGGGMVATTALVFTGTPDLASLPYLMASFIIHLFYWTLLGKMYSVGDLGHVYPIARGLAPILTTLAGIALLGEYPHSTAWLGILGVVAGVVVIAVFGSKNNLRLDRSATNYAMATAICIMGYSIVDGIGARHSQSAFAYTAFLYACNGWVMLAYGLARQREALVNAIDKNWYLGILTGGMSLLGYSVGVWAMTKAPIGLVAALRETSILFAILLGTTLLKEPFKLGRLTGAVIVFAGLVAIRLA